MGAGRGGISTWAGARAVGVRERSHRVDLRGSLPPSAPARRLHRRQPRLTRPRIATGRGGVSTWAGARGVGERGAAATARTLRQPGARRPPRRRAPLAPPAATSQCSRAPPRPGLSRGWAGRRRLPRRSERPGERVGLAQTASSSTTPSGRRAIAAGRPTDRTSRTVLLSAGRRSSLGRLQAQDGQAAAARLGELGGLSRRRQVPRRGALRPTAVLSWAPAGAVLPLSPHTPLAAWRSPTFSYFATAPEHQRAPARNH